MKLLSLLLGLSFFLLSSCSSEERYRVWIANETNSAVWVSWDWEEVRDSAYIRAQSVGEIHNSYCYKCDETNFECLDGIGQLKIRLEDQRKITFHPSDLTLWQTRTEEGKLGLIYECTLEFDETMVE